MSYGQPYGYNAFQQQFGTMPGQDLVQAGLPAARQPTDPRYDAVPQREQLPTSVSADRPESFPVWPGLNDCLRAYQEKTESTLVTSQAALHQAVPFDARYFYQVVRFVINVPAAVDATANAGGLSLAAAASVVQPIDATLEPVGAATDPVEFFRYQSSSGHVTVFKSWGTTVQSSRPENVLIEPQVIGGPAMGVEPPSPLISGVRRDDHVETLIVLPDNKTLVMRARNLDTCSAQLVAFGITGWILPSAGFDGTLQSLQFPQRGYRIPCSR